MKHLFLLFSFIISLSTYAQLSKLKTYANNYLDGITSQLNAINDSIWNYAEPSLQEFKSVALLKKVLRNNAFDILENAGGLPTQFVATYGHSGPIIALYGEYDADPGASNHIVPYRQLVEGRKYGHGGGHNLLGVGSLGAALAIKKMIETGKLNCTIKYFGTTAEGGIGGKTFLAKDGFFDGLDFSLYWHPSPITKATTTGWDAQIDVNVFFYGKKYDVFKKISQEDAEEALISFLSKLQDYKKEKIKNTRLNYVIRRSGNQVNSVSDTTQVFVRIMSLEQIGALAILDSIRSFISEVKMIQPAIKTHLEVYRATHQFVTNLAAMEMVHQNMQALGPIRYTSDEQSFTKRLQDSIKSPPSGLLEKVFDFENSIKTEGFNGYGSDIGDASWYAPETYFIIACLPNVPMHSWTGTIFTGHSIGQKGMIYAAKILSQSIIDYVTNAKLREAIYREFQMRTAGYKYRSLIEQDYNKR